MDKKGVIDRFEGDWAVVEMEDGKFIDIPTATLPSEAVEGSVICMDEEGGVLVLTEETEKRRDQVKELVDRLFED